MAADLHGLLSEPARLRAAINTGNGALVQRRDGGLHGVSPALAARLAQALGAVLEPVVYDGAGKVVADAAAGRWDVAFLAVDPARADRVAFTRPYVFIDTTYAVRADAPDTACAGLDRPGAALLVGNGSAYDLHLTKTLRHASLLRADSPGASIDRFLAGEGDGVAGVRETLEARLGGRADIRILPDAIVAVGQAMAVPVAQAALVPALDAFLDAAHVEGMLREATAGAPGLRLAPRG